MMNEKIIKFLEEMEKSGINTNAYHWIPKWSAVRRAKNRVMKLFKDLGVYDGVIKIERCCSQSNCVNPFHYRCIKVQDLKIDYNQATEIEELASMVDVDTLTVMGFGSYLEFFNKDNPLPAKPLDFFMACNRALHDKHKPLLDWCIYREGNYED